MGQDTLREVRDGTHSGTSGIGRDILREARDTLQEAQATFREVRDRSRYPPGGPKRVGPLSGRPAHLRGCSGRVGTPSGDRDTL